MDPISIYERAATRAADLARGVRPEQMSLPTPCSEWDVGALLEHMAGGSAYLFGALGLDGPGGAAWPAQEAVFACVEALREPGTLDRRCMSPAGFEWSVAEAVAGTAMDQLIHTWDLGVAVGEKGDMDPELAGAIVAMFLPAMPEMGRQAGFVGAAVAVSADASAQERLLGAMGRDPAR
jgi:uncharacterized protein (TIGR03086 family)